MSQNQEIIESKLCSFVDGELDEAGRAEIEKHLTAHPQHRRLLEELRRTSALVRGLPRENAPPELAESFTSQLERSVLLQGVGEEAERSALRIGPGPRLYAAAAIILLMVGLAAVIYFALPSYNVRPTMASSTVHRPLAPPNSTAAPSTVERDEAKSVAESESTLEKQIGAPTAKRSTGEQPLASAGMEESLRLRELARKAASDSDVLGASEGNAGRRQLQAPALPSVAPGALVMLVQSDDLDRAHRKLEDYFAANGIAWAPSDERDVERKSDLEAAKVVDRSAPARPGGEALKSGRIDSAAPAAPIPAAAIPPGAIAGANTEPTTRPQGNLGGGGDAHGVPAGPVQTQPSMAAMGRAPEFRLALSPARNSLMSSVAPGPAVVFAVRMSRRQAAALGSALELEGVAQRARVLEEGAPPLASADKAADQLTHYGATAKGAASFGAGVPASRPSLALSESAQQLNSTPADTAKKLDGSPTTQLADANPATRPDEAGENRNLAERGAFQGRGVSKTLPAHALDAKDTTQPATSAPDASALAEETPAAVPAPLNKPTATVPEPTTHPGPATQPGSALSLSPAGLDELLNVVILVQATDIAKGIAPAATAAPQTQPASPATEPADPLPASQPADQ